MNSISKESGRGNKGDAAANRSEGGDLTGSHVTRSDLIDTERLPRNLKHLLAIEGLSRDALVAYIENGIGLLEVSDRDVKKVPTLRGRTVINLFLEPSTRTRTSFEIAAKRLSADAINISESGSSVQKGETLLDTAQNLESMSPDILVIRHKMGGAAAFMAQHLKKTAIVNAGDGAHEHPTQALLDCVTLARHFKEIPSGKKIAIVGDIRHSRVARSNIWAHQILGNELVLVGPPTLVPKEFADNKAFPDAKISVTHNLEEGIAGADAIICLRMQTERQALNFVPTLDEYSRLFCLSKRVVDRCAPQAVILHPGPMNRGVEISSDLADGVSSMIKAQVESGVAVRMAVLLSLVGARG